MPSDPIRIEHSFVYQTDAWILVFVLLAFMVGCIYVGRRVGVKMKNGSGDGEAGATGTTISAMFGLLAFLLAFTFSMSASRYDTRRKNIVDEANAISTAVLRADLYPEEHRTALRKDFQQYVEARILYFDAGKDIDRAAAAKATADDYGTRLWDRAAKLSQTNDFFAASQLMIPALNGMLDISTTRLIAELSRVPDSIIYMLFILSLSSAFYLGYSSAAKGALDWFVAIGFCVLTAVVIYITLDLDRPRRGFIQLSTSHMAMFELRKLF